MDEVRIWDIARTEQEIATTFNRTINPNTPGLVGYWNFNEDIDDQNVFDSSVMENHGVLGSTTSIGSDDPVRVISTAPLSDLQYDAEVVSILTPAGVVDFESMILPQVVVRNNGLSEEAIPVSLQIGFDYQETVIVSLLPGEIQTLGFPKWNANLLGTVPVQGKANLLGDEAEYNDTIEDSIYVTQDITSPIILDVSPSNGGNIGTVTMTLNGDNYQNGLSVKLSKLGEDDVEAEEIDYIDATSISANFDLEGLAIGPWDIIVTNPDLQFGIYPSGFTVEEGGEDKFWVELVGKHQIRTGLKTPMAINYGNAGNVNTKAALIVVTGIPSDSEVNLKYDHVMIPLPKEADSENYESVVLDCAAGKLIPIQLMDIQPGYTGIIPFELTVYSTDEVDLRIIRVR